MAARAYARSVFALPTVIVGFIAILLLPGAAPAAPTVSDPFPIAVTAGKEMGFAAAFDGTNFLTGIVGNTVSSTAVTAQRVSPAGALVGERIDTGRTGGVPGVAFDGTNHLLAWKDATGSLYGQFVGTDGSLAASPFEIAAGPLYGLEGFSFGAGVYLAAYTKVRKGRLYGKTIQPNGVLGSEVTISSNEMQGAFGIACDGVNFFLAWTDSVDGFVKGRFVSPAGTLGTEFTIDDSPAPSDNPGGLGFDGTNYLVAWMDQVSSSGDWDLYGRLVTPAGTFPAARFPILVDPGFQFWPSVIGGGGKWLVVWTDFTNDANLNFLCEASEGTCWDIYGRFFAPDGTPSGGPFAITTAGHNQLGVASGYAVDKFLCFINDLADSGFNGPTGDVSGVFVSEDATPVVTIVASDAVAAEKGPNTGTFTVTRTGETTGALAVNYTIAGTAKLGADYSLTPAPAGSLTIPAGSENATITVTPVDDIAPEPVETVVVTLIAAAGYTAGIPGAATVSIASNDPTISLSKALDLTRTWKTGGSVLWYGQKAVTHDSVDAARPDILGHGRSSWLQLSAKGPAQVSFWWKTSSEAGDRLRFSVDGVQKVVRSGLGPWQQKFIPIGSGNHVLRWEFRRNASGSAGLNTGFVDQITIAP